MKAEMPQTDEVIRQRTGKTWIEWRETLDAWGAADKGHTEIAAYVSGNLGIDDWWAQGVTVGYERMIGRRAVDQRNDGSYSASVSKSVSAGVDDVHAALVDDRARAAWLDDGVLTLRTASAPKSARFDDLQAGVIIAFHLTAKGERTAVQVQADGLSSQDAADAWKAAWRLRLNDLAKRLS